MIMNNNEFDSHGHCGCITKDHASMPKRDIRNEHTECQRSAIRGG